MDLGNDFFDILQSVLSPVPFDLDTSGFVTVQDEVFGGLGQGDICDLPYVEYQNSSPHGASQGSPPGQDEGSQGSHSGGGDFPVESDLQNAIIDMLDGTLPDLNFTGDIGPALQGPASAPGLLHAPEGCHASYPTMPQPTAKTGSRAFSYIPHDALLETDGIPALSSQALVTPGYDGTALKDLPVEPTLVKGKASDDVLCGTMNVKVPQTDYSIPAPLGTASVAPKLVPCEISGFYLHGTQTVDSKLVPHETSGSFPSGNAPAEPHIELNRAGDSPIICGTQLAAQTRSASVPCGTQVNTEVPDRASSVPIPCGTQTVKIRVTVPEQITSTSIPCDTQTADTKQMQNSADTCHSTAYGTVPINTSLIPASESGSGVGRHLQRRNASNSNVTKKRVRKRKNAGEAVKKTRKYEQGPLSDHQEERKRLDAIRAKRCRERNRSEVQMLREKVAAMEQEKSAMVKELAGREAYEAVLRKLLWEETQIAVLPFSSSSSSSPSSPSSSSSFASSSSDKMAPPQLQTTG